MTTGTETKGVQLYLLDATDSGNEVRETGGAADEGGQAGCRADR